MTILHHETEFEPDDDAHHDVDDWFARHPVVCALLAAALVVVIALCSHPNLEMFP